MSNDIEFTTHSTPSTPVATVSVPEKKKRGFACLNPDQVRELARRGGVAAHRAGTAHEFNTDEARAAGRKGGLATHAMKRALQATPKPPAN